MLQYSKTLTLMQLIIRFKSTDQRHSLGKYWHQNLNSDEFLGGMWLWLGHSLVGRGLTCAPSGGCMWQWAPPSALQNKTPCWKKISDKACWCSGVGNVTGENIAESGPKWHCMTHEQRAQRKGTQVGMRQRGPKLGSDDHAHIPLTLFGFLAQRRQS